MEEEKEEKEKVKKVDIPKEVKQVIRSVVVMLGAVVFITLMLMLISRTILPHNQKHYGDIYTEILK
jgi:hypothetical protein